MEEVKKKMNELHNLMCNIRQTEYMCRRNRNMLENAEIDRKISELKKLIDNM